MFYGWRVVAGAFAGMVLGNGIFTYGFTLLVDPIRQEFGVSLEDVMYSLSLGTLFGLVVAPVTGMLVDRYSIRGLMTLGCLITAAGLYAIANASSILAFNLLVGVTMALSLASISSMPGSAAVSRWFTASRGRALGIATMGSSAGGVIVPALMAWWIEQYGWRAALQYLALTACLVVMPFIWLTIRSRPEDVGMKPESPAEPAIAESTAASPGRAPGMAEIVRSREFWLLGLSMGCVFAAFSSMLANLSPYAARLGVAEAGITAMIAVLSIGGLVGKLAFGIAADRVNLKYGLWVAHLLLLLAFAILLLEPAYPLLMVASFCFGLCTGGLLPVWNSLVARIFGIDSFGRAMGAMGPVITLSILPAYAVMGRLFDMTGSYTAGLWVFAGIILLAAGLLVPLRVERPSVA